MKRKTWHQFVGMTVLCLLLCLFADAQTPYEAPALSRTVPDTAWARWTAESGYGYRNTIESANLPKQDSGSSSFAAALLMLFAFLASGFGQFLLWTIFGILVLYGVYRAVAGSGKFSFRKSAPQHAAEVVSTEDPVHPDWAKLAEEAAGSGDYRLATRYGYRLLLERLNSNQKIHFEPEKSDAAYVRELAGTDYAVEFRAVLRQYERSWFGGYTIGADEYRQLQEQLQTLLRRLPE